MTNLKWDKQRQRHKGNKYEILNLSNYNTVLPSLYCTCVYIPSFRFQFQIQIQSPIESIMPLTENQEMEMKSIFEKYSSGGSIGKKEIGKACRAGGLNPTEADLTLWKGEAKSGLDERGFKQFMSDKFADTYDSVDEIIESFQMFDTSGSGYITVAELKTMLTTMGEKMTKDEVQVLLDECDVEPGNKISYLQLSHMLFGATGDDDDQ